MATTIVTPIDENAFNEVLRQNAALLETQRQTQATLDALNRRTAMLPDPVNQRPPAAEFRFDDPTGSAKAVFREMVREEVAPYVNSAIQGTAQVLRTNARQIAERNPELADVFTYFGPEIDQAMNDLVGPAGHADPKYWLNTAKLVAFDKGKELAQKRQTARDTFTETGGPGGGGPSKEATELDQDTAALMRKQGQDPNDPKILVMYNKIQARRRGEAA